MSCHLSDAIASELPVQRRNITTYKTRHDVIVSGSPAVRQGRRSSTRGARFRLGVAEYRRHQNDLRKLPIEPPEPYLVPASILGMCYVTMFGFFLLFFLFLNERPFSVVLCLKFPRTTASGVLR